MTKTERERAVERGKDSHQAISELKEYFLSCLFTLTAENDTVGDRPSGICV